MGDELVPLEFHLSLCLSVSASFCVLVFLGPCLRLSFSLPCVSDSLPRRGCRHTPLAWGLELGPMRGLTSGVQLGL